MSRYIERVAANILPLSEAKTLPAAFREWHVTGHVSDYEDTTATCELCEQEGLRYHFRITNKLNGNVLEVGSSCILQFELPMADGTAATKGSLDRLIQRYRTQRCLNALRAVAQAERSDILAGAMDYFDTHGCLSPKLAWVVLWRLRHHGIEHEPQWFKVTTRKSSQRRDLLAMRTDRVLTLWPALSSAQQQQYSTWWVRHLSLPKALASWS
jgi:hypothetical protein